MTKHDCQRRDSAKSRIRVERRKGHAASARAGFYWDDCEDHGSFDRISPNGPFQTRASAEYDARLIYSAAITIEDGRPAHYDDG